MKLIKFLSEQLQKPTGLFGRFFIDHYLNWKNLKIIRKTINILDIKDTDHVLDIGFGGGASIRLLLALVPQGFVAGIDISDVMVKKIEKKFSQAIKQGLTKVEIGNVVNIPFHDNHFDKIMTVHTIYFWPDRTKGIKEIYRVLKPSGRVAIAISSPEKMKKLAVVPYGFLLFSPDNVRQLLIDNGFNNVKIYHDDDDKDLDCIIVTGYKPA